MRRRITAGNWKMFKTKDDAVATIASLSEHIGAHAAKENIYIAAPFVFIDRLIGQFGNTSIVFGAQNISEHEEGAYTGEVSAKMLQSIHCRFVIIGHSERRQYFHETDAHILAKILLAIKYRIEPVFCCGELIEDRNKNEHFTVIRRQIENTLFLLGTEQVQQTIIAYEPVWAIGTGVTASPEQAQEMHHFIRALLQEKFGVETAENISILYGGSVKPANAKILFSQPDIDGGLVGGASLKAEEFIQIIQAV